MVIKFNPLNARSVDDAIKKIEEYQKDLDDKLRRFRQLIAERIRWSAESGFSSAITSDIFMGGTPPPNNVTVTVDERDDMTVVIANGEQAVFIEFGAGVYYNGGKGMIGSSPHQWGAENQFTIGTYGKGYGSKNAWALPKEMWQETALDKDGNTKLVPMLTRGTPAAMPMFHGVEEAERVIGDLAREVFA